LPENLICTSVHSHGTFDEKEYSLENQTYKFDSYSGPIDCNEDSLFPSDCSYPSDTLSRFPGGGNPPGHEAKQSDKRCYEAFLSYEGLALKEVQADGNCLFRAVAEKLEHDEGQHEKFRNLAIKTIVNDQEHFVNYLDPQNYSGIEDYVAKMSKTGFWGDHTELYALSRALRV